MCKKAQVLLSIKKTHFAAFSSLNCTVPITSNVKGSALELVSLLCPTPNMRLCDSVAEWLGHWTCDQ